MALVKKVEFEYSLKMSEEWLQWVYSAKERFEEHLKRCHASDIYNADIDYCVSEGTMGDGEVFGTITLFVPEGYEDLDVDDLEDVARLAIEDTIKYNLSPTEQKVIEDYEVKYLRTINTS